MSDPLDTALQKGWTQGELDENGIFEFKDGGEQSISYPKEMYEDPNSDDDGGYWETHRSKEILKELKRNGLNKIVEIGAGTGSVCGYLAQNGIEVVAVEPLRAGAESIQKKGIRTICGRLESVNFPTESIEVFGVFDVLEHIENPNHLLNEMYRTLKPGGYLLVTVPCGQWLWGEMDKSLGHFRRYSRNQINDVVNRSGFKTVESRYLFLTLVAPALLFRAIPYRLGMKKSRNNVLRTVKRAQKSNRPVNTIMDTLLRAESNIDRFMNLPYGLTVFSVYKKI
jgi:SAM-dependent methyltransferase